MRVSMKWNAAPSACETFSYGEVEDYTVNIGSSSKGLGYNNITIDGKLGNEASIFDASVSPNPSVDFVKIKLADDRNATFKVTTLTGQQVLTGKVTHNNLDVSNLHNGIYILEVNDGQKSFTKKIIKK
ncbi:T9SS C-terminal target domain-containing protein [Tenacibaculum singaporense]|uniref:T9SS C-terminal target domain-containing protein n=2 Tax=Tenacibaculum TaxID=104267 RepID=A0A451EML0_9FLAO|nr:T9SS C-terminal target domain-containing protein [Tenacibaculum singaporense]